MIAACALEDDSQYRFDKDSELLSCTGLYYAGSYSTRELSKI